MKKLLVFLIAIVILTAMPLNAFATASATTIEKFEDGSYGIIAYENDAADWTRGSVSKSKTYTYYDSSNTKCWMAKLTGTFTYTGSSATCTSASKSYTIYNDDWKCTSSSASKSGRTANGTFTFKRYLLGIATKTVNKTLTLSCSNSGVVS